MKILDMVLEKLGYVKQNSIKERLNFAYSVGKRLDEHREIVEAIEKKTSLLDDEWHISHLSTQDDYLMRLFFMVHGQWPDEKRARVLGEYVRARPPVLDECQLPEYRKPNSR